MSRCRLGAAALAVIGYLGLPLAASADLCPGDDLVDANMSGSSELLLMSDDEEDMATWDLKYCPATGCFFMVGDGEPLTATVGFMFGADATGALTITSCEESTPSSFMAKTYESDPETLPGGFVNPAPNTDNCFREFDRHTDENGEPGGFKDFCIVLDGSTPILIVTKNGDPFPPVAFDMPIEPGGPGECDVITIPGIEVDSLLGRLLVNLFLPTTTFPECTITIGPDGLPPVLILSNSGVPQPATGDIDRDGDVDIDDIRLILARRNQMAEPPVDRTDVNGDGVITVLDARFALLLCDLPGCASP